MKTIDGFVKVLACIVYTVLVGVTVAGVFFRYVLNDSLVWGEELGRYLFIWIVYIGAAIGVERGVHVNVDFVLVRLPPRPRILVALTIELGILIFLLTILVYGIQFTRFGTGSYSLAMQIPMAWVYGALPLSALMMAFFTLRRIGQQAAQALRTFFPTRC